MAEIVITIGHNGGSVKVATGDVITVQLPENPTTGYRWQRYEEADSARILAFIGDSFQGSDRAAPGAGGTRIFRFAPQSSGAASLHVALVRSWQQDAAPRETFRLHVDVA